MPAGTLTLWDSSLKGFGVRVSRGGTKTFIVLIASGRRQSVGRYPLISLSEARTEAKRILAEKTLGRIRPPHTAFDDAKADFLEECERRLRPLTLKLYRRHLAVHFPFGRTSVADITPRQIVRQLDRLNDRPSEKEHAHRIGRTFFRWCVRRNLIDRSPMENMATPPIGSARERVLDEEELATVYRTASAGRTPFHRLVALLILLGLRRTEAASLQWSFFRDGILTLPGEITKNKRTLVIPYGQTVARIINETLRLSDTYLFPAAREQVTGKPVTVMTGFGTPKRRFDNECGVTGWTLHDLRRTLVSSWAALGIRLEVTEKYINHVSGTHGGIVGVYQRHTFLPEMREAVGKWEAKLTALAEKPAAPC